jgi:hypothetical protein
MLRRIVVSIASLLLIAQVVRNAAVEAFSELQPSTAAKFWAGHPSVETSLALADIGRATRDRTPIDPKDFAMVDDAARKSPLAAEPFLVRGVQAQIAGQDLVAKQALVAAQWRDPRSLPAAYFLANYYLHNGDILGGLEETALLARLSPGAGGAAVPFVSAYAESPSNWPQMRALFRSQAGLEDPVLLMLARNARNADAILALADAAHRASNSAWLPTLLQSLVQTGEYGRARAIWMSIGHGHVGDQLVYDASFESAGPPPPFNWSLTSSTVGIAERQPGKRLHLIFFGNEDGVLARELVLLPAGSYRLQMNVVGASQHLDSLRWSVRCDNSQRPITSVQLDQAARGLQFQVPAGCPAQWIEFSGLSGDIAQQSEATITGFNLTHVGGSD